VIGKEIITYPSIPWVKIGGMKNEEERIPLYGSVRSTITGDENPIFTHTESFVSGDLLDNEVYINKKKIEGKPKQRVEKIFYELKEMAGIKDEIKFKLESENIGYPTGGGLASSAAGLAGSTLSLYKSLQNIYPDFYLNKEDLTRVARLGSTTAIGSIIGSYAKIVVTNDDCWGERIAEPDALPDLCIGVVLIKDGTESDKIHRAMEKSRFKEKRIKCAEEFIRKIEEAILNGDTAEFIKHTHEDTKNFHSAILDQGIPLSLELCIYLKK
jgi:mevalonate pyrophosphate decarboxylase